MIKKYFKLVSIIVVIMLLFEGVAFGAYMKVVYKPIYDPEIQAAYNQEDESESEQESDKSNDDISSNTGDNQNNIFENTFTTPVRTNFLVVGVDKEEALTDTIMVCSYESTGGELHIVSIPRDTYVELENYKLQELKKIGRSAPSYMKINSVNVYGGKQYGMKFLRSEIEEMLGIKIDYYVKVNVEAFRSIVDTIGGVEYNVPQRLYYSDPTQDLLIDLYPGLQVLNGKQAEGLVRFRKGYATQDLHRVEVQQDFVKVFIGQLMQKETIKNNFKELIVDYLNYVETDFGITDIPKYIKCFNSLDSNKVITDTLPGYAQMIGEGSYYIHDVIETAELVQEFFYGVKTVEEETTTAENIEE